MRTHTCRINTQIHLFSFASVLVVWDLMCAQGVLKGWWTQGYSGQLVVIATVELWPDSSYSEGSTSWPHRTDRRLKQEPLLCGASCAFSKWQFKRKCLKDPPQRQHSLWCSSNIYHIQLHSDRLNFLDGYFVPVKMNMTLVWTMQLRNLAHDKISCLWKICPGYKKQPGKSTWQAEVLTHIT